MSESAGPRVPEIVCNQVSLPEKRPEWELSCLFGQQSMAKLGIPHNQKRVVGSVLTITFKPLEYPWHRWLTDISSSLEVDAKQDVGGVKGCTCEMHLRAHICVILQSSARQRQHLDPPAVRPQESLLIPSHPWLLPPNQTDNTTFLTGLREP